MKEKERKKKESDSRKLDGCHFPPIFRIATD